MKLNIFTILADLASCGLVELDYFLACWFRALPRTNITPPPSKGPSWTQGRTLFGGLKGGGLR